MQHRTLRSLRATFQRALTLATVAGPGLGLAGCDSAAGPGIADDPDFVPIPCNGDARLWLGDLSPTQAADYLQLVTNQLGVETVGEPCTKAADPAACLMQLAALTTELGFPFGIYADHEGSAKLRLTRGDEAFVLSSKEQLIDFLGGINTPGEAVFMAQVAGYDVLCDGGGSRPNGRAFEVQGYRYFGCGGRNRFLVSVATNGTVEEISHVRISDPEPNCVVGRRPQGLRAVPHQTRTVGDYLARAATLEAASVHAFEHLALELRAHAAPHRLVRAARDAAQDEVRHAGTVGRLARRFGASVRAPVIDPMPVRELEAIALENAAEGCVRETFGALAARWQALCAQDRALGRSYARIAEDELRHAALSWRVARFLDSRLSAAARRRVDDARRMAIGELEHDLASEPSPSVQALAGVPSAQMARSLARHLSRELA